MASSSSSSSDAKTQQQKPRIESETFTFRGDDLVRFWIDDAEPLPKTSSATTITTPVDPTRRMWRRLLNIDDSNDDGTSKGLEALTKATELQVTLTHAQKFKSVRRSLVIVDGETNVPIFSCYSSTPLTDILPPILRVLAHGKLCVHNVKLQV